MPIFYRQSLAVSCNVIAEEENLQRSKDWNNFHQKNTILDKLLENEKIAGQQWSNLKKLLLR